MHLTPSAVLAFDTTDLALLDTNEVASGLNATTYAWTVVSSGAALQVRLSDSAGGVVSSAVFSVVNATLSTSISVTSTAASESASTAPTTTGTDTFPPLPFPTTTETHSHGGMSQRTVNQIIGGVLGGFVLLAILVALIVFHWRHRRPGHPPAMLHDGEKSPSPADMKKRRGSELSNGSSFFSGVEDSPRIRPSVRAASISNPLPLRTGSRAETSSYISQMYEDASGSERGPSRESEQREPVGGRNSLDGPRVSIDSFYSNPDVGAAGSLRSVSATTSARATPGGSAFNSTSMLGIGIAK